MDEEKSQKQILEEQKLKLEINELEKKWYKKPNYLQVLLPTTVAIGSLLYAIFSGVFSTKYDQFLLQQERLKLETMRFEAQRDKVKEEFDEIVEKNLMLDTQLKQTEDKKLIVQKRLKIITLALAKYKLQLNNLEKEKFNYIGQISSLDSNFKAKETNLTSSIKKLENLKKQLTSDIYDFAYSQDVLSDSLNKLHSIIGGQKNHINELTFEIESRKNPFKNVLKDLEYEGSIIDKQIKRNQEKVDKYDYQKRKSSFDQQLKEINRRHFAELKRLDTLSDEEVIQEFIKNFSQPDVEKEKKLKPIFKTKKD